MFVINRRFTLPNLEEEDFYLDLILKDKDIDILYII